MTSTVHRGDSAVQILDPACPQNSSLMFSAREDGDTSPLLPLLLVTMATLLLPFPWMPAPPVPPPFPAGGVGVVVEEAGCWSFFLLILRSLARRFWNQIFTCRRGSHVRTASGEHGVHEAELWFTCLSDRLSAVASSAFRRMVMYLL